jgi:uncharacterized RmlC-like cupin family protein
MAEMRVVRPNERDRSTAQTPGMDRAEGVGACTVGASGIWAGHVTVAPGVKSGAHHHGEIESAIYIISGRARFRYGERLEHVLGRTPAISSTCPHASSTRRSTPATPNPWR